MPEKKPKENAGTPSEAEQPQQENKLRSFLISLATDAALLGRYIKNPDSTINEAGLSPEDKAVLQSGNPVAIHSRLAGQATGMPAATLLVVDMASDGTPSIRGVYPTGASYFPQQATQPPVAAQPFFPIWSPPGQFPVWSAGAQPFFPIWSPPGQFPVWSVGAQPSFPIWSPPGQFPVWSMGAQPSFPIWSPPGQFPVWGAGAQPSFPIWSPMAQFPVWASGTQQPPTFPHWVPTVSMAHPSFPKWIWLG